MHPDASSRSKALTCPPRKRECCGGRAFTFLSGVALANTDARHKAGDKFNPPHREWSLTKGKKKARINRAQKT